MGSPSLSLPMRSLPPSSEISPSSSCRSRHDQFPLRTYESAYSASTDEKSRRPSTTRNLLFR
eukprot:1226567-Prymnesium_polylepis.1